MERTTMFIEMNSCFLMDGWMDGLILLLNRWMNVYVDEGWIY